MNWIKFNLMFCLAGFLAGAVLVERWRRQGDRIVPAQDRGTEAVEPNAVGTASELSAEKPKTATSIVRLGAG